MPLLCLLPNSYFVFPLCNLLCGAGCTSRTRGACCTDRAGCAGRTCCSRRAGRAGGADNARGTCGARRTRAAGIDDRLIRLIDADAGPAAAYGAMLIKWHNHTSSCVGGMDIRPLSIVWKTPRPLPHPSAHDAVQAAPHTPRQRPQPPSRKPRRGKPPAPCLSSSFLAKRPKIVKRSCARTKNAL